MMWQMKSLGRVAPLDLDRICCVLVSRCFLHTASDLDFVDLAGFEDGADYRTLPDSSIDGALAIESAVDDLKFLKLNVHGLPYVRELDVRHVQFLSLSHDSEIGETRVNGDGGLLVLEDGLVTHGLVVCHGRASCHVQTLFWKKETVKFKRQCVLLNNLLKLKTKTIMTIRVFNVLLYSRVKMF